MNIQTFLNIVLGALTVWLTYRNFTMSTKKDAQKESQEITEIRVQLNHAMLLLQDLRNEMQTNYVTYCNLSERVAVIETKLSDLIETIDEIKAKL